MADLPTPRAGRITGPEFTFVDEVRWEDLGTRGFGRRSAPLLVRGAVKAWPAWEKWTFEYLAGLRKPDGSDVVAQFVTGLTEQGITRDLYYAPVAPYLLDLARARDSGEYPNGGGLLPDEWRAGLKLGEKFQLDWAHLTTFVPDRVYLSLWEVLKEFPALRRDFAIRQLWPGRRLTWEYVFVGPANTITGFHTDFPNNWFCQVHGTKEVILVSADQTAQMCVSPKYDWGASVSAIDITRPGDQPREWASFSKVRGQYARVEAGDALFIPKKTWHAVVAREPAISLAVFGLTPLEVIVNGGKAEFMRLLHYLRLYRWGNCTCHRTR
jgi:lysine-specific demethylase 8